MKGGGDYSFYVFSLDSLGRHVCDTLILPVIALAEAQERTACWRNVFVDS